MPFSEKNDQENLTPSINRKKYVMKFSYLLWKSDAFKRKKLIKKMKQKKISLKIFHICCEGQLPVSENQENLIPCIKWTQGNPQQLTLTTDMKYSIHFFPLNGRK